MEPLLVHGDRVPNVCERDGPLVLRQVNRIFRMRLIPQLNEARVWNENLVRLFG